MKPILDNLTEEYAGRMDVVFIDVWKNRDQAARVLATCGWCIQHHKIDGFFGAGIIRQHLNNLSYLSIRIRFYFLTGASQGYVVAREEVYEPIMALTRSIATGNGVRCH